jgi:hypothetical protein
LIGINVATIHQRRNADVVCVFFHDAYLPNAYYFQLLLLTIPYCLGILE